MAYLEIININKNYGSKQVLQNINLEAEKSSFISLLGQSGCGKTTLLRIIAGLEQVSSGVIRLDGNDITNLPSQFRNIGIVFQSYALFPHLNVSENIAYGLKIKKYTSLQIVNKVSEVLEKVNLSSKAKQNVSLLSGGEQQRVALARAIVTEPQVLLLDEPLSNLDYSLRLQARNELKRLQSDIGITSIYVTHDQSEALALSDRISVMNNGNIIQTGTPREIYWNPANAFTAGFVGRYNTFNKTQSSTLLNCIIPDNAVLAVLPEHLDIHKSTENTNVFIKDILFTGILTECILSTEEYLFKSVHLTNGTFNFNKGDFVSLSVSKDNTRTINL